MMPPQTIQHISVENILLRILVSVILKKENGVKRFLNDGDMWLNYSRKIQKEKEEEEFKINIEDYID